MTYDERIQELKEETKAAESARIEALKNFYWERTFLWAYHSFRAIAKSYQEKAASGKMPHHSFLDKVERVKEDFRIKAAELPSWKRYLELKKEAKELRNLCLHVQVIHGKALKEEGQE